jgi:hypothetical protein
MANIFYGYGMKYIAMVLQNITQCLECLHKIFIK